MFEHSSLPPHGRGNPAVIISPLFAGVIIAVLLTLLAVSAAVIASLAVRGQHGPSLAYAAPVERPYAAHQHCD